MLQEQANDPEEESAPRSQVKVTIKRKKHNEDQTFTFTFSCIIQSHLKYNCNESKTEKRLYFQDYLPSKMNSVGVIGKSTEQTMKPKDSVHDLVRKIQKVPSRQ